MRYKSHIRELMNQNLIYKRVCIINLLVLSFQVEHERISYIQVENLRKFAPVETNPRDNIELQMHEAIWNLIN